MAPDVKYVRNGLNHYEAEFSPTRSFSHEDYDKRVARKIRKTQKVLGRQTVLQFKANAQPTAYTPASMKWRLHKVLEIMGVKTVNNMIHAEIGGGSVTSAVWKGGNAVVVYDGRSHLFEKIPFIVLKLRDRQSRGHVRVVAFQ